MAAATIGAARIEMMINSVDFINRMKRMRSEVGKFRAGINNMQRNFRKAGRNMSRVGKKLNRNVTLPVVAAGGAALKSAVDFESSMTRIQTLVGLTADKVNEMRQGVLSLSRESGRGPQELSQALFTVTSAGARGAEAMQILERASKAAAIGLGETQAIARSVTAVMQAYGKENISAAKATDTLTAIVREGNLEAESLAPALGRVVGMASQLGISFDELGASIATYTRLGVSAEEATTGIRSLMNTLIKPSQQARKALSKVGLTFEDLRSRVQDQGLAATMTGLIQQFEGNEEALGKLIPNVRALSAVLGTAGSQGEAYQQIQRNIADSLGIVDKGFEDVSNTVQQKFNKALSSIKASAIEIGAKLLPVASKVLDKVNELATSFANLSEESRNFGLGIVAAAAMIGPTLTVFGGLATAIGTISLPMWAAVAAGVALGTVAASIIENWQRFKDTFTRIWIITKNNVLESIAKMIEAMGMIPGADWIMEFDSMAEAVRSFKGEVPQRKDMAKFVSIGDILAKTGRGVKHVISGWVESFLDLKDAAGGAGQQIENVITKLTAAQESSFDFISKLMNNNLFPTQQQDVGLSDKQISLFKWMANLLNKDLIPALDDTKSRMKNIASNVAPLISTAIGNMVNTFLEGIGIMMAGSGNIKDVFHAVLSSLANLAIRVGKIAVATGLAIEGIKKALESLNPFVAIAAGAALIALGSFVKSSLARAADSSGDDQAQHRSRVKGMAQGGVVPPGFPNDSYPAGLTSGERVIPDPLPLSRGGGGISGRAMEKSMEKAMSNALAGARWKVQGSDLVLVTARGKGFYS